MQSGGGLSVRDKREAVEECDKLRRKLNQTKEDKQGVLTILYKELSSLKCNFSEMVPQVMKIYAGLFVHMLTT